MTETKNRVSPGKWVALAIAALFMFATGFITPPSGLSQGGFQVLGILVGAIILFLSWGTGWPSMAIVFALMTVPGLSMSKVTAATFGNSTAVFLLFTFMLAASLTKSGAARRIAVWFMTNKFARKSPWWTVVMIFLANYVLNLFLSTAATIMVMLPIVDEILVSVGCKKESKPALATALMLGVLVTGLISNAGNPISHAVCLQGFSFFESYTGETMDFFTFCAINTPVSIITFVLFYLVVRFIWRPDVSMLKNVDHDNLAATVGHITKKEKWSIAFYLICVVLWLMPGLTKYFWPAANAAVFSKIGNCLPPLAALFLMNFIKVDGEPILGWTDTVKSVSWPTYMFIGSIMGLGSFMGNEDLGISIWLSDMLSPMFANVSPMMFLFLMLLVVSLLTNFCSNSVSHSVVFAVAMPLCLTVYAGQISTVVVASLITASACNGWSTPPASPTSAVVYGSDWVNTRQMIVWGLIAALLQVATSMIIGVPIGNLFG